MNFYMFSITTICFEPIGFSLSLSSCSLCFYFCPFIKLEYFFSFVFDRFGWFYTIYIFDVYILWSGFYDTYLHICYYDYYNFSLIRLHIGE